MTSEVPLEN